MQARLIDDASAISEEWFEGIESVGLTAGASAPEVLVEQVSNRLAEYGFTDQSDLDLIREVRNTWQFYRDRRPETYAAITAP